MPESTNIPRPPSARTTLTRGCGSMYTRPALPQIQSSLLKLPTELRLQICGYMTLAPTTTEWNGAFFSCRQLHQDMLDQPSFRQEATISLQGLSSLTMTAPHPFFSWLRSMTIVVKLSAGWCESRFKSLYALHLDSLQIRLAGDPRVNRRRGYGRSRIATPYGDLTTVCPPGLATPSGQLKPFSAYTFTNCKKITLTLDRLASADGSQYKQTSFHVTFEGTDKVYLFTVAENKEGKQVERSYTFDTRFEMPTPLPPIEEAEGGPAGCGDGRKGDESADCEGKREDLQEILRAMM